MPGRKGREHWYDTSFARNGISQDGLIDKMRDFFLISKNPPESKEKLFELLNIFPQNNDYSVAGSWGIEILTGKRLNHSDIDLLFRNNYYLDDALDYDEHYDGYVPLAEIPSVPRFVPSNYEGREIMVPNPIFQLPMKIIGERGTSLSDEAQIQLKALINYIVTHDYNLEKYKSSLNTIMSQIPPITKKTSYEVNLIINALSQFHKGVEIVGMDLLNQAYDSIQKRYEPTFENVSS